MRIRAVVHKLLLDDHKALADRVPQTLRVERAARAVHKARNAVFLGFGLHILDETAEPAGAQRSLLKVEAVRAQHLLEVDLGVRRGQNVGRRVELAHKRNHLLQRLGRHEIALVHDHRVGELKLVHHQVANVAVVLLGHHALVAVDEEVGRVKVVEHARRINDRAARIEPRHRRQTAALQDRGKSLVLHRVRGRRSRELGAERLCHLHRLRDTTRLDQQIVNVAVARERRDLLEQVCTQRTADTAIRHLDHVFVALHEAATGNQLRINVQLAHVVHNHGNAQAVLGAGQNVAQQRRFTRAQEATQQRHGQLALALRTQHLAALLAQPLGLGVHLFLGARAALAVHLLARVHVAQLETKLFEQVVHLVVWLNVARTARQNVHMHMVHRLARRRTVLDGDAE